MILRIRTVFHVLYSEIVIVLVSLPLHEVLSPLSPGSAYINPELVRASPEIGLPVLLVVSAS
jgi:hypothetical protein